MMIHRTKRRAFRHAGLTLIASWYLLSTPLTLIARSMDIPAIASPVISTRPSQHGAMIATMKDATAAATIYYTVDGSAPTEKSTRYFAPLLIASRVELKAIAMVAGKTSAVALTRFEQTLAPGTLAWSDEFANTTGAVARPDAQVWMYEAGAAGAFGNHELETYCAWASEKPPCAKDKPNAFVGTDGYLHVVAEKAAGGAFTSARLTTQGTLSFRYGRVEARIKIPEAQGMWPAFWLLGNDIATISWPAAGEQDVMEHVNAPAPDWIEGSVHGTGFIGGDGLGTRSFAAAGSDFAGWHTYGMTWKPESVAYYVDDPAHPYVTYTPENLKGFKNAVWPFDAGRANFLLLNLAVGGDWPGAPDAGTTFPAEMLVDWVRVYAPE